MWTADHDDVITRPTRPPGLLRYLPTNAFGFKLYLELTVSSLVPRCPKSIHDDVNSVLLVLLQLDKKFKQLVRCVKADGMVALRTADRFRRASRTLRKTLRIPVSAVCTFRTCDMHHDVMRSRLPFGRRSNYLDGHYSAAYRGGRPAVGVHRRRHEAACALLGESRVVSPTSCCLCLTFKPHRSPTTCDRNSTWHTGPSLCTPRTLTDSLRPVPCSIGTTRILQFAVPVATRS